MCAFALTLLRSFIFAVPAPSRPGAPGQDAFAICDAITTCDVFAICDAFAIRDAFAIWGPGLTGCSVGTICKNHHKTPNRWQNPGVI